MFAQRLAEVRRVAAELGQFSWTSDKYQRDILNFIVENRDKGRGIIEVGTYKGGFTAQLAVLCKEFGWPLWTIDVEQEYLGLAAAMLSRVAVSEVVEFHLGPLDRIATDLPLKERPVLVILDGDHRYNAVIDDIGALYKLSALPRAAAFHDYSLRHPTTDERVSDAVRDSFGDCAVRLIGTQMDGANEFPTKASPAEDGHWWEVPGSEGAIIELPPAFRAERQPI